MATIKTIKPAGGGDYTTLQSWEDWADGQASGAQWAECYSGGNLGYFLLENWTGTINSSNYPRIYAADGHRHNGDITQGAYVTGTTGAYCRIDEHYVELDGIRFSGIDGRVFFRDHNYNVIKNCMIKGGTIYQGILITNCLNAKIYNNIIFDANYGIHPSSVNSNSSTEIYNNTFYNCDEYAIYANEQVGTCTVTIKNNIIMSSGVADFAIHNGTPTVTSDYNIVSDGSLTSNSIKGSNDLENQTLASVLTDAANDDFTIVEDGPAHDAGTDLSATVSTDILGIIRPRNKVFDIGAYEFRNPHISEIKSGGGGDFTTLASWEDWADGQPQADMWAECYSGGSLGGVAVGGWTSTPTASVYPRIYAADGHRWDGDPGATAAYIDVATTYGILIGAVNYVHVDGLMVTSGTYPIRITQNATIENCYCHDSPYGVSAYGDATLGNHFIANNIVANCTTAGIHLISSENGDANFGSVLNNTVYNCVRGFYFYSGGSYPDGHEVENFNVTLKNNISVGNATADYLTGRDGFDATAPSFNFTNDSNLSSDTSLTTIGATTNALQSQSVASVLTDAANDDFTLATGSPAIDAGADLSGTVDTDVAGAVRPQNSVFDIGAFESAAPSFISTNRIIVLSHALYLENDEGVLIEHGLNVDANKDLDIEYSLYNSLDREAPVEHALSSSTNKDIELEHILDILSDKNISIEHLLSQEAISTNKNILIEHLLNISSNKNAVLEHLLEFSTNKAISIERLLLLDFNKITKLEHLLNINELKDLLVEHSLLLEGIKDVNIEHSLGISGNKNVVLEHMTNISTEKDIPLEHLLSQNLFNADKNIVLEHLAGFLAEPDIPVDHSLNTSFDKVVPVEHALYFNTGANIAQEHLLGISTSKDAALEYLSQLSQEKSVIVDHRLLFNTIKEIPLEHLTTFSAASPVVIFEYLLAISKETGIPIEHLVRYADALGPPGFWRLSTSGNNWICISRGKSWILVSR